MARAACIGLIVLGLLLIAADVSLMQKAAHFANLTRLGYSMGRLWAGTLAVIGGVVALVVLETRKRKTQ